MASDFCFFGHWMITPVLLWQAPHGNFRQPMPAPAAAAQRDGVPGGHGNPAAGYYPGPAANRGGPAGSRTGFAGGAAAPGQRAYAPAPVLMAAPAAYGQQQQQQYSGAHLSVQYLAYHLLQCAAG